MANELQAYLRELRLVRGSGEAVAEPSYYPALSNLLNSVGERLNPKVHCVINIKNRGAGFPDGGLFTPDQLRNALDEEPLLGQAPARGVIEVKGTADDAWVTARGEQVTRYWGKYRQVLVTNLRDFVLVGQNATGNPVKLETYRLADSEAEFWAEVQNPRALARRHGDRFIEFIRRVLLHAAPLTGPRDLAALLAAYAREARFRVESVRLDALVVVRSALEEALGLRFEGARGDAFFRSTLIQTLFYGVFSAWVLWAKQTPPSSKARFNWHETPWWLHVPMIRSLYEQLAMPSRLAPLGLVEVLDWAGDALNRVNRPSFFQHFEEHYAVQYFYEPFLEAFDPELRRQLGIWYTPPEVVHYMVKRVDTVLREELGIPDGLADQHVYVLDPCVGTGSYLVEVLRCIEKTLRARREDALIAQEVKQITMDRVFGFEILPAPFVVAHLQLGLLLQNLGAPLSEEAGERAGVYLTNSLTGWEPLDPEKEKAFQAMLTGFRELIDERDRSRRVKQDVPILVILGNPPYSGFAGVTIGEERTLTEAYRQARRTRQPQGQGLNDLYVRFFRMAERRITEQTGRGVVCFISNYSWLDSLSCPAMRERYLEEFDRIWIDCLNGDKFKTGKLTPNGKPDPSIFSTEWNREGIQVGTAIALLVRKEKHQSTSTIRFRHLWGKEKRAELLSTAIQDRDSLYQGLTPPRELGFPFLPLRTEVGYFAWPRLVDLFEKSYPGVKTSRDNVVADVDEDRLVARLERYFDPAVSHEEIRRIAPSAMHSTARFNAEAVRDHLTRRGFLRRNIVPYYYRPFDLRRLYWEPETKLLDEKREDYFAQVFKGNVWLSAGQRNRMDVFYQPQVTTRLADHHIVESNVSMFPLYVARTTAQGSLFTNDGGDEPTPNLTPEAAAYLARSSARAADLFYHCLAILHSPGYQADNLGGLRQDWPRVPLPDSGDVLRTSAGLGREIGDHLDLEHPLPGVTVGAIRAELRLTAIASREGGGSLDLAAGDLAVTAGWGHAGQGGVAMPGKGRVLERQYSPEERTALKEGAKKLGLEFSEALFRLGETTYDVYLNDRAYWRNVPASVWRYTLGGYQVVKKWLSYRERDLLGRPLTVEEVKDVTAIAHRIAAILLLEPAVDSNYQAVKQGPKWVARGWRSSE